MIDRARLMDQLQIHEGIKLKPYVDTAKKITIGVGRNLTDVGITLGEALDLLNHDIDSAVNECEKYGFYATLDEVRQNACTELMFNLGPDSFSGFHKFITAMTLNSWAAAEFELRDSQWAVEVGPVRSTRLRNMIVSGAWPT